MDFKTTPSEQGVKLPNRVWVPPFAWVGNLEVRTGAHRLYNDFGYDLTIESVRASLGTAPTGSSVVLDVNKNGTSIFTTQANRPTVAAGTNTVVSAAPDVTQWAAGEYLTVDIDQIGSTTPGADLQLQVKARRA